MSDASQIYQTVVYFGESMCDRLSRISATKGAYVKGSSASVAEPLRGVHSSAFTQANEHLEANHSLSIVFNADS